MGKTMAVLKCKMCGGTLLFQDGATVGVCDSCGAKQALPNSKNSTMTIHVTRRELRIKSRLLIALAAILGLFGLLYLILCHDGNYNEIIIDTNHTVETTTRASAEADLSQKNQDSSTSDKATNAEESSLALSIAWEDYDALEELQGENWSLTLINFDYSIGKSYSPNLSPLVSESTKTADSRVSEAFEKMYKDARDDDIILTPYSAYANYSSQQLTYDNKVNSFIKQGMSQDEATKKALMRVDPGGCSENNAGLAVDIVSASSTFSSTNEYAWLVANAHKYGFVLRYPEDKTDTTGKIYQPWHWRYVGVEAAIQMKEKNLCLEEYLGLPKE